jgi:hypothetical protein
MIDWRQELIDLRDWLDTDPAFVRGIVQSRINSRLARPWFEEESPRPYTPYGTGPGHTIPPERYPYAHPPYNWREAYSGPENQAVNQSFSNFLATQRHYFWLGAEADA